MPSHVDNGGHAAESVVMISMAVVILAHVAPLPVARESTSIDSTLTAFDILGFQTLVDSVDDAFLLQVTQPTRPIGAGVEWRMGGVAFDGVMWGTGADAVACQYYSNVMIGSDPSWSRFLGGQPKFPKSSRLFGRSSNFAWNGYGNGAVEIRLVDDNSQPLFWVDLKILRTIFTFSSDPVGTFEREVIAGRSGTLSSRPTLVGDDSISTLRFTDQDSQIEHVLWIWPGGESDLRPAKWMYAIKSELSKHTFLTSVCVKRTDPSRYSLPKTPADLIVTHRDIDQIENVALRRLSVETLVRNRRIETPMTYRLAGG